MIIGDWEVTIIEDRTDKFKDSKEVPLRHIILNARYVPQDYTLRRSFTLMKPVNEEGLKTELTNLVTFLKREYIDKRDPKDIRN